MSCDWLWLCVSVCGDQWESVCFESRAVIGCDCVLQSAVTNESLSALSHELWLVVIVCFSLQGPMRVCLLWVMSCDWLWLCVSVCGDQWESVCSRWWSASHAVSSVCLRGTNRSQWTTPNAQCFLQGGLCHLQYIFRVWNSLPPGLCVIVSVNCFRNKRKTFLFSASFNF